MRTRPYFSTFFLLTFVRLVSWLTSTSGQQFDPPRPSTGTDDQVGGGHRPPSVDELPSCSQPLDRGAKCQLSAIGGGYKNVFAAVKYYYDNESKTCRMFLYYGCEGNGNSFSDRSQCQSICGEVAQERPQSPPITGGRVPISESGH